MPIRTFKKYRYIGMYKQGPMLWFLKHFRQKYGENWAIFAQTTTYVLLKKNIIIGF
jgi:hypothetical protein